MKATRQKKDKGSAGIPKIIWWWMGWVIFWIVVAYLPGQTSPAQAPAVPAGKPAGSREGEALHAFVTDLTGSLDQGAVARITESLARFEKATSNQIALVIYPQLPAAPIEEFTIDVAERSRLGRQGLDNGAILSVFAKEKVARLEVGYGLESVLTDAMSQRILESDFMPLWNAGRREEAAEQTIERIENLVRNMYTAGKAPNRFYVLYRQLITEAPRLLKGVVPMLKSVPMEGRVAIAFFGTFLLMGMWDGLVQARDISRNCLLGWRNFRQGKKISAGTKTIVGESAVDSLKVLLLGGGILAMAVAFVVVAGNGAFGGAGAMIRM